MSIGFAELLILLVLACLGLGVAVTVVVVVLLVNRRSNQATEARRLQQEEPGGPEN